MKLCFRLVSGETFHLDAQPDDSVGSLKDRVVEQRGIARESLKLLYKGKALDRDGASVAEAGVTEEGFVVVFAPKAKAAPAAAAPAPPATAPATAPPADAAGAAAPTTAAPSPAQPASASAAPDASAAAQQPAAASGGASGSFSASAASNLLSGSALEEAVSNICEMGFDKEEVTRAMRAAFNNPERAVEYLTSGAPIPEAAPPRAPAPAAGLAAALQGQQGQQGAEAAQGPQAQPFNMFAPPSQQESAEAGPLDFLRSRPEFQLLRRAVQGNPNILVPMLAELGKSNPQMLQLINSHQQEFLQLLQSGEGEGEGEDLESALGAMGGEEGAQPISIQLTPEEVSSIERLEALGFDRQSCLEAFLACDKNEELAANYLAETMFD